MDNQRSKVVLLPCGDYQEEQVYLQVKRGLELLGGIETLIEKDERILLKPNLLKKAEVEKAVITHPVVMGAFVRILRENGYRNIVMGDSCGTGTTAKVIQGTGMDTLMEGYQVPVVDFSKGRRVEYRKGKQAADFVIAEEALQADAIVSICKMKTHALERITGAVKNTYGCVQGLHKAQGHTKYPSADSFARMLTDLNQLLKPRLYLMDGIVAMEGNGPGSGEPVSMRVLLMSTDPVALDSIFCRLIHLEPSLVPTNYHGEKMGLGYWQKEKIQLLGPEGEWEIEEAVRRFGSRTFRVDRRVRKMDKWVFLGKFLNVFQRKPVILGEKCVKCGICVESCPVEGKAVRFTNGKKEIPVYDYRKCIRCYCCQEMCPQKAIEVK